MGEEARLAYLRMGSPAPAPPSTQIVPTPYYPSVPWIGRCGGRCSGRCSARESVPTQTRPTGQVRRLPQFCPPCSTQIPARHKAPVGQPPRRTLQACAMATLSQIVCARASYGEEPLLHMYNCGGLTVSEAYPANNLRLRGLEADGQQADEEDQARLHSWLCNLRHETRGLRPRCRYLPLVSERKTAETLLKAAYALQHRSVIV